MGKKIKRAIIIVCLVFVVIVFGFLYYDIMTNSNPSWDENSHQATAARTVSHKSETIPDLDLEKTHLSADQEKGALEEKLEQMGISLEDQLVKELRKFYGANISRKSTQASIYGIRESIVGSNPDGLLLFYNALKRAFPRYADEIMDTLDKLDIYHQWLEENDATLSQMTEEERMAALWEKRFALFGEDAKEIWTDGMLATDAREAEMTQALDFINESDNMLIEEKLDLYQNKLREVYGGTPEEYLLSQTPIMSKIFFSIDSVQDELKNMSPDQRQMEINKIRREMGFSEQQVEYMEKIDTKRNRRWETGLKYMEKRKKVVSVFEGDEQKEQLNALREKIFGDEAKTIELEEEKDGFFRFERPRYYGRN